MTALGAGFKGGSVQASRASTVAAAGDHHARMASVLARINVAALRGRWSALRKIELYFWPKLRAGGLAERRRDDRTRGLSPVTCHGDRRDGRKPYILGGYGQAGFRGISSRGWL